MIRDVWRLVFGDDVLDGTKIGPHQYRVVCPFHGDTHASCDVNVEKDAFYCRSCPAYGGYLDVVIQAENAVTRREAVLWLERRGLTIK